MKRALASLRRRPRRALLLVAVVAVASVLVGYSVITLTNQTATSENGGAAPGGTTTNSLTRTVRYMVQSPQTGQWTVIRAMSSILSVTASNTGSVPAYQSLASLNQTVIGYECTNQGKNGVCNSFGYVQQTGWFWDVASRLLTVHYLGGANVTLTVVEGP